ncbi:unnamed protein product [Allacma fusca]|uniref:G domain-containing protein n=1 Tax=Allacma fusca TaxID=39272 RepID=A0A8J2JUD7_9HEXA|nr:unnamed protein product [Allacma fusca]
MQFLLLFWYWYANLSLFNVVAFTTPTVASLTVPADQIPDETIELIKRGYQDISFRSSYKSVVLVVGNPGVGKTTLTKFITGKPLTAYKNAGQHFIKDADDKISHGSTLVSKTILPEMIIDDDTNQAYFDLPGFGGTRNASIELVSSWFMKLAADHANRVKIVFVVPFSTIRFKERQTDFKDLLEHATSFILQPTKFQPAIALVASKVDGDTSDDTIVPDIAEFLENEKEGLRGIFGSNRKKLQKVLALVDAFLVKSPSGDYERIGYFKQPTKVGTINNDPEMKVRRKSLKDIIDHRLQFVRKEQGLMTQLATAIQQYYQHLSSNTPAQVFLGKFLNEVAQLEMLAQNLARSHSRLSFTRILEQHMSPVPTYNAILKELQTLHKNFEFYENIDSKSIPPESLEWTLPLQSTVNQLKLQASKFLIALNTQAETYATKIVSSFQTLYQKTIHDGNKANNSQQEKIKQRLSKDLQLIEVLKKDLPRQLSFNSFWNIARTSLGTLSVSNMTSSSQPPLLANDITFQSHPQLKRDSWTRKLYHLFSSISIKQSEFVRNLQAKKHEALIKNLNSNVTNLLENNSRVSTITENNLRRLSGSIIQHRKDAVEMANKIRETTEKEARLQEQRDAEIRRNQEARLQEQRDAEIRRNQEARLQEQRDAEIRRNQEANQRRCINLPSYVCFLLKHSITLP